MYAFPRVRLRTAQIPVYPSFDCILALAFIPREHFPRSFTHILPYAFRLSFLRTSPRIVLRDEPGRFIVLDPIKSPPSFYLILQVYCTSFVDHHLHSDPVAHCVISSV